MPRLFSYSSVGKRCYGQRDWHAKGRINVIGAFLRGVVMAICLFNCNIDSEVFHRWVNHQLLPQLSQQSVIVLDNATFHKRQYTQQSIRQAGHILEYLPPYSPDLNPIEHKWAQAKTVRKQKQCSVYELFQKFIRRSVYIELAICGAIDHIHPMAPPVFVLNTNPVDQALMPQNF